MTKTLQVGDILEIKPGSKRMIYLGDNIAQMQLWFPVSGEWKSESYTKPGPLTDAQVKFWLSKKEA